MPKKKATPSRRPMTAEHKAALAQGRAEGLAVRRYLEALEATKPRRGRRRTAESIEFSLASIDEELGTADPLTRLHLLQEKEDLQAKLAGIEEVQDISEFESDFVAAAKSYAERRGISYATWRGAGVSAAVLKRAGIARSRA
jgi:hypothetical protein